MSTQPLKCSKCGALNPTDNKFCGKCGTSLFVKCSKCGAENEILYQFCGTCGTPLQSPKQQQPSSPQPPLPPPVPPKQTLSGINTSIPPKYESRLQSLIEKNDKLIAWYNIKTYVVDGEQKWWGDGAAITRDKVILFGSGCFSDTFVKVIPRYGRSVQDVPYSFSNELEMWTGVGKVTFEPKTKTEKDEMIRLLSG